MRICWTMAIVWLLVGRAVFYAAEADSTAPPHNPAATAGETQIAAADVAWKMAVERAYGNAAVTPEAALAALIGDALQVEVGRRENVAVAPEESRALAKHINETSRAPEILAKVKAAFGGDWAAYERLYLNPRILNEKLRGYYSRSAGIHAARRAQIENAFRLAVSDKTFKEAATEGSVTAITFECGGKAPESPSELAQVLPTSQPPERDPLIAILEAMSAGEIYKNIVEDDASFKVIRLAAKNGNKYTVEALQVQKPPFEEWFQQRASTVSIIIHDRELKAAVQQKYAQVWWVRQISSSETK